MVRSIGRWLAYPVIAVVVVLNHGGQRTMGLVNQRVSDGFSSAGSAFADMFKGGNDGSGGGSSWSGSGGGGWSSGGSGGGSSAGGGMGGGGGRSW